jgi:hypothetical protein
VFQNSSENVPTKTARKNAWNEVVKQSWETYVDIPTQ